MVRRFTLPFPKGYGLRLHRIGCANRPFYLIGAMPKKVQVNKYDVDKRPDEVIGSIDPMPNEHGELVMACDLNKLCYYLGKGATPSRLLYHYLSLVGFLPIHPKVFINAWRERQGFPTRGGIRPSVLPKPGYRENERDRIEKLRNELKSQ